MTVTTLDLQARVQPGAPGGHVPPAPTSWFITHCLGGPAAGTYTEVVMPDFTPGGEALPEHVKDDAVRAVAGQLYGSAWAFHYRPDQYADSIACWNLARRELVVVTSVEVWV